MLDLVNPVRTLRHGMVGQGEELRLDEAKLVNVQACRDFSGRG
jgi:hypothetical protein